MTSGGGSAAEAAGLQAGDLILGVGNRKVASPAEAASAIRQAIEAKADAVVLRVQRHGRSAFVGVPLVADQG